jgi:curli production assembly/transport component CsgE
MPGNIVPVIFIALIMAGINHPLHAQEQDSGLKIQQRPEEFGGVVVDLTTTGFGHMFYQRFVALWQDNPLSEQYSIAIRERATARYGSNISIEYAQRRVFQAFLPPSPNAIRTASENAVAVVYENIMTADVQRLMFRDADLGADEI